MESEKEDNSEAVEKIQKYASEYRASYEIFKELNINDALDD